MFDGQNRNLFQYTDFSLTLYNLRFRKPSFRSPEDEWDIYSDFSKMNNVNFNNDYFTEVRRRVDAYELLFDWMFDYKTTKNIILKLANRAKTIQDEISGFWKMINEFRVNNFGVLNAERKIIEYCIDNPKSPLAKRIRKKFSYKHLDMIEASSENSKSTMQEHLDHIEKTYGKIELDPPTYKAPITKEKLTVLSAIKKETKRKYEEFWDYSLWKYVDCAILGLETGEYESLEEAADKALDNYSGTKKINSLIKNYLRKIYDNLEEYFSDFRYVDFEEVAKVLDSSFDDDLGSIDSNEIMGFVDDIEKDLFANY